MKVTRVIYNSGKVNKGTLLTFCSVILDDCLQMTGISLHSGKDGYYLIFPSKQDVYKSVSDLNEGVSIEYPPNLRKSSDDSDKRKDFEEFFHPVSKEFYIELLNTILDGYTLHKEKISNGVAGFSYRPE